MRMKDRSRASMSGERVRVGLVRFAEMRVDFVEGKDCKDLYCWVLLSSPLRFLGHLRYGGWYIKGSC